LSWIRNDRRRALFLRLLSPGPGEKVLDVGAGKGAVASLVQQTGSSEVVALDPSTKRIAFVRHTYPNLKTCHASSESMPYGEGFFDKVYSTAAVHHFSDKEKSFLEIARVLKQGGLLVIVDIAPGTLLGRINRLLENGVLRYHLKFLELRELTQLLTREGDFEIKETVADGPGYFVQAVRTKTSGHN
jgi:ubiquinone/menaquinone biosynthesis C-methylase UbiE